MGTRFGTEWSFWFFHPCILVRENVVGGNEDVTTLKIGLNNIYSDKVHDIHKYNVKIVGSDSKPVAYLDHLLDML